MRFFNLCCGVAAACLNLFVSNCTGAVSLSLRSLGDPAEANLRTQFFRDESIAFQINSDPAGGELALHADIDGQSTVVWRGAHDRTEHVLRVSTQDLRIGQYAFAAVVNRDGQTELSAALPIGINPPIDDAFPIFTFTPDKRNIDRTPEGISALIGRYRAGGYNQVYFFQRHGAVSRDAAQTAAFLNDCARQGMGAVPMLNTFLYGVMDDESCSLTASGNFATTYVYHGSLKRMTSVRHPRHIEGARDFLRRYASSARHWPVIRGIDLDDEPTATFYNVFGAGRVDKAPDGEQFWGLGDYNAHNVSVFRERYGVEPPRYALASEVHDKYPPGSIVSRDDPWFAWMAFTGATFGDYYAAITPTLRQIAPDVSIFSQPFLGLCGTFWGLELQSFHRDLDRVNFHYIGGGAPVENAASGVILSHSIQGEKPIMAMVQTANFDANKPGATVDQQVYSPAHVMQQFWGAIGTGAKGIGDQGEWDISQRADTWQHWTSAAQDVADVSPLLLKATRPRSEVALLYSVESEWMQSAYRAHPLEIWRQHHIFEMIQAALQRASIPFDIVSTTDLANDPRQLDSYSAVICAAFDYAFEDVRDALQKTRAALYITPQSALRLPNARTLQHNFDELYRLYLEVPIRDPRTYHAMLNERSAYFKSLLSEIPTSADAQSANTLIYMLDTPGGQLMTVANGSLNWQADDDPSVEEIRNIRAIIGNTFEMPKGIVTAPTIDATIRLRSEPVFAYDLRAHQAIDLIPRDGGNVLTCSLEGGEGTMVLLTPSRIDNIEAQCIDGGNRAVRLNIAAFSEDNAPLKWALPIEIEILQPDGAVSAYSSRALVEQGQVEVHVRFAANDPLGRWSARITELASGKQVMLDIDRGE